jgi:hypothetical protein
MNISFSEHRNAWAPALLAGLLATACSSGGGDSNSITSQMTLPSVSVTQGQEWKINRPIQFNFSQPVDFSTVDQSSINISQSNGEAAVGTFISDPTDPRVVVFQPTCPTKADLSDSGLKPGRTYRIRVGDVNNSTSVVRSMSGAALQLGTNRTFVTPSGTDASELFIDLVPGAPSPRVLPVSDGNDAAATYLEAGLDDTDRTYFVRDVFGNGALPVGEMAPLNLYSRIDTRMAVIVEFNQPVNPLLTNINADRVYLEYLLPGGLGWSRFESRVELIENCSLTGAAVRLTPVGVLPQNSQVRAVVAAEFEDLVGNTNNQALVNFALMDTDTFEEMGVPVEFADEVRTDFLVAGETSTLSREDTQALLDTPPAAWGGGQLRAAFDFSGTGGPGGNFDWHVPANTDFTFDTTQTVIVGGPDGVPTTFLTVINGRLDINDLVLPSTSRILIQGNNPAQFLISGEATIDGQIIANGASATSVFTLDTPHLPEPGAAGRAGGGSGGIASYLTTQSTPRGGSGNGPLGAVGLGGQGGEAGWNNGSTTTRRGGGGGGGVLGKDVQVPNTSPGAPGSECDPATRVTIPDQSLWGLDAEDGFYGSPFPTGKSAVDSNRRAYGGQKSLGPFDPVSSEDDFFGLLRKNVGTPQEFTVRGELESPTAGAGGGAGGDATKAANYPPVSLIAGNEDKGCGGAGGGGSFTMLALGDITFGAGGKITADGGSGNGGENVSGWDRIGAGSGGGSGGHIILQTASRIDLSAVPNSVVAISAKGGQGGCGANGAGGANEDGNTTPGADARHVGADGGADNDNPFSESVCNTGIGVRIAAGGDGGPGLIQLHVGKVPIPGDNTSDILLPAGNTNVYSVVKPPPLGYDNIGASWVDQPVPFFGRLSKGQSKWIALGEVATDPVSGNPSPIEFFFDGTDPLTGLVETTLGTVTELDPILEPAADISAPGLPEVSMDDPRTLMFDAGEFLPNDVIFKRNPALLTGYELKIGAASMTVATASYDSALDVLSVTVESSDPEIPGAGLAELIPRFFRVQTNGVKDALPSSSEVTIEFQAAPRNSLGVPDELSATAWVTDIEDLNTDPNNTDFRFLRFRVSFDIAATGSSLSFNTPRPSIEFLTVGFRF